MAELVSFDDLKALVSITDVADWLRIKTKVSGNSLRGECPLCADERSFTITPAKGMWGCFKCQKRGSILDLVYHVKKTANVRDAGLLIQQHFLGTVPSQAPRESTVPATRKGTVPDDGNSDGNSTVPPPADQVAEPQGTAALKPLDHLTTDHPAIEALGLSQAVCSALGIGYAAKGIMRGRVVFPLRLPDGTLVGYQGLATSPDQAPLLLFPKNLDEKCQAPAPQATDKPKASADEMRKLFRVVA